jgi:hypothetical protein
MGLPSALYSAAKKFVLFMDSDLIPDIAFFKSEKDCVTKEIAR